MHAWFVGMKLPSGGPWLLCGGGVCVFYCLLGQRWVAQALHVSVCAYAMHGLHVSIPGADGAPCTRTYAMAASVRVVTEGSASDSWLGFIVFGRVVGCLPACLCR